MIDVLVALIVRAQLSNSELILLFLNCLSVQGREKFKPLVEKYALFEHIPSDEPFLRKIWPRIQTIGLR